MLWKKDGLWMERGSSGRGTTAVLKYKPTMVISATVVPAGGPCPDRTSRNGLWIHLITRIAPPTCRTLLVNRRVRSACLATMYG